MKKYKWPINTLKYSTSLDFREMQIKISLEFHFTPIRVPITKKTRNQQMSLRIWGEVNPYTQLTGM
jgi:hypothetical protein